MIKATILEDSISPAGVRLTTFEYQAPRSILAEINTHRVFTRNARSSRAVPTRKLIEEVRTNPFIPISWGKNQPGMQAHVEMNPAERQEAINLWLSARDYAVAYAEDMANIGAHKQIINRLLEPWMWVYGVLSSTKWDNFFSLRCHSDAEPHFQILANGMRQAMENNNPKRLVIGEWHLPYVTDQERASFEPDDLVMISAARCARVSYRPHGDGATEPDGETDLKMAREKLITRHPIHASPFEHQATPDELDNSPYPELTFLAQEQRWKRPELHGNFHGWVQSRKVLETNLGDTKWSTCS